MNESITKRRPGHLHSVRASILHCRCFDEYQWNDHDNFPSCTNKNDFFFLNPLIHIPKLSSVCLSVCLSLSLSVSVCLSLSLSLSISVSLSLSPFLTFLSATLLCHLSCMSYNIHYITRITRHCHANILPSTGHENYSSPKSRQVA